MGKSRISWLSVLLCVVFWGGCRSDKLPTGKFSDEEMANIGLVEHGNLPLPAGGFVLSVGSETITVDEIVSLARKSAVWERWRGSFEKFKIQAREVVKDIVLGKVSDILLYQKARRKAPENIDEVLEKAVEKEVNRFVTGYGGNYAEAQEAITAMGLDWRGFRDYKKREMLIQSYLSEKLSAEQPVTHGEMLDYYNLIKDERFEWEGTIEFRLIDIQVAKVDMSGYEGLTREEAGSKVVNGLLESISESREFGEIARQHSHGHRAKFNGLWTPVTAGSLMAPHDVLEAEAEKMEVGEVSAVIENDGHFFIMKLENKQQAGYKAFEEVQENIEREIQLNRRMYRYEMLILKLINQANITDMDDFVDFCIEAAYREISQQN